MGCNCKDRTKGVTYPYEATLKDGSKVMVSSAADLRTQQERAQTRMRQQAAAKGYSARVQ